MSEPCGFLEEAPGEKSSTRLFALMMITLGVLPLVATVCVVAIRNPKEAPGVIAAIGGVLIPLAGGIWGVVNARR